MRNLGAALQNYLSLNIIDMSGTRTLDYADRDAKPVPTKPRGLEYDINSQLRVELVCIESGNSDTREYKVLGLPKDGDGLIWGTIIDPKNGGFFFRSPNGVTAFTPAKNLPRLDEVFPPRTILAYRVIHEPVEPELSGGVPDTQAILLDEPNAEQQPSALSLAVSSVLNAPLSNSDAPQAYEIPEGIEIDPSFGLTL